MSIPARRPPKHTIADWLAQPEERRYELIDGELVEKASPDFDHGLAQGGVVDVIRRPFHRRSGGSFPGGWWIVPEVDVQLGELGFRPDVSGWRRDRIPQMPRERPVKLTPDWICEIVSESNATTDTVVKLRRYHQGGVPYYWLIDRKTGTLTVYRHQTEGYLSILIAERGETVRAQPFDAIELRVGLLLGDDPDEPAP